MISALMCGVHNDILSFKEFLLNYFTQIFIFALHLQASLLFSEKTKNEVRLRNYKFILLSFQELKYYETEKMLDYESNKQTKNQRADNRVNEKKR